MAFGEHHQQKNLSKAPRGTDGAAGRALNDDLATWTRSMLARGATALRRGARPSMPLTRPPVTSYGRRATSGGHFYGTLALILLVQAAALVTHVESTARHGDWTFLFVGVLAYPVGIAHGAGCWFGWWS